MARFHLSNHTLIAALAVTTAITGVVGAFQPVGVKSDPERPPVEQQAEARPADPAYLRAIELTADMVYDQEAQRLAAAHGLQVLNVTWEDTGRFQNSAVGPNISDMTIQIQHPSEGDPNQLALTCMPVIRFPNFEDRSCDLEPEDFSLLVGNESGEELRAITLRELLENPRDYLHDPDSWPGEINTLLADRDTHVLVSAQACFLPVPQEGEATFNPVLFNYQSSENNPAVLTILVTREGTSMTIIDNTRDGFEAGQTWGQRLFFNANGERASFTGTRASEFLRENIETHPPHANGPEQTPTANDQAGLNMVLLIQVPLKHEAIRYLPSAPDGVLFGNATGEEYERTESDVEEAVIGHGDLEGPFTEIDGQSIERDPDFPVRVTVQFYQATSNGVVTEEDMARLAAQIQRVYEDAAYVGSLVTQGDTGRPTHYNGPWEEPPGWWQGFWQRYEENTGQTREEALRMIQELDLIADPDRFRDDPEAFRQLLNEARQRQAD